MTESPPPRWAAPAEPGNRFVRDGDAWSISFEGDTCVLADRKGLRDLARLLAEPGAVAAQDLMATGGTVIDAGSGPVIDDEARDRIGRGVSRSPPSSTRQTLLVTTSGQRAWRLSRRRWLPSCAAPTGSGVALAELAPRPSTPAPQSVAASVTPCSASTSLTRRSVATSRIPSEPEPTASTGPDPPVDWTAGESPHTV